LSLKIISAFNVFADLIPWLKGISVGHVGWLKSLLDRFRDFSKWGLAGY
jgi:hypothetical protein